MKTDELIRALAADTTQARPLWETLLAGLVPALLLGALALWLVMGFRMDLVAALETPVSLMRMVLSGAIALFSLAMVLRLAHPQGVALVRFWPVAAVMLVAAGLWIWAWLQTPAGGHAMAIRGKTMWFCLTTIPLLSILPVAAIFAMLRQGAPTRPRFAGAVAGLAGGGLAATVYALHCTEDNPLFFVTWYGLAILIVTLISSQLGARLLRW
jgi:hypothetical protein